MGTIAKYMNYFLIASVLGGAFYFIFLIHIFPKIANEAGLIVWVVLMFFKVMFDLQ